MAQPDWATKARRLDPLPVCTHTVQECRRRLGVGPASSTLAQHPNSAWSNVSDVRNHRATSCFDRNIILPLCWQYLQLITISMGYMGICRKICFVIMFINIYKQSSECDFFTYISLLVIHVSLFHMICAIYNVYVYVYVYVKFGVLWLIKKSYPARMRALCLIAELKLFVLQFDRLHKFLDKR